MNINRLKPYIDLVRKELVEANEKFPLFQTRHEAYAVMKEELEEVIEEIEDIKTGILKDYWELCRRSKEDNEAETSKLLKHLEIGTLHAINELIQVGAMIEKSKLLEGKV